MTIEKIIEMKGLTFLKNKNKELKEEIEKENNYDVKVLENLEIEIMKALMNFKKLQEKIIRKCHWCGKELYEKDIEELSNARGYGYYITCSNCNNRNVIQEIDLTRES